MLTNEELKVAIIMMKRASCTGEESAAVATVIMKLEALFNAQEKSAKEPKASPIKERGEGSPGKKAKGK